MSIIQDERFTVTCDISGERLLNNEILGLADAPGVLTRHEQFDPNVANAITVLFLDMDGVVTDTEIGIAGGRQSWKLPASTLFADAPAGTNLRIKKLDFAQFKFGPSQCFSEWVHSTDIDWGVMLTNNLKDGLIPVNQHRERGISPWSCRLHVSSTEEANKAIVRLVAVPTIELNTLPGNATGSASAGYPTILLGEVPVVMAGQIENIRQDGLAFYPAVVNRGMDPLAEGEPTITLPTSDTVRASMSAFWSSTSVPTNLLVGDWSTATAGPQEPDQSVTASRWIWPSFIQVGDRETGSEDSDSGEYHIQRSLYLSISL